MEFKPRTMGGVERPGYWISEFRDGVGFQIAHTGPQKFGLWRFSWSRDKAGGGTHKREKIGDFETRELAVIAAREV